VERRKHPRLRTSQPVVLQLLPDGRPVEACILDISARGVHLRSPAPLPVNARIRIDTEETLLLGEVTRCTRDSGSGAYHIGVHLQYSLAELAELERLNRSLLSRDDHRGAVDPVLLHRK